MKILLAVSTFVLLLTSGLSADIIYLDNGTKIEGTIQRTNDSLIITTSKGIQVTVKLENVTKIEVTKSTAGNPPGVVDDRLASLRRVVDNMADVHLIIERYEKFIAQNAGSPALDDARKDLLLWHDRLDQGLVKVAGKWVTPQQRDQIQAAAQLLALQARDLLKQNRLKDAEPLLLKAISDDPQNATALYLRGVMLYKQDQIGEAKKCFDAVNLIVPGYAPNLNNLAVIAWRMSNFVLAMSLYDQAMLASPQAKAVLDNVAEALHALPEENTNAPLSKKCALDFQEQDTLLQKAAAQDGWFRWGATWVTAKQLDDLKAAEAKIKAQLDVLNKDGDDTKGKMATIDGEIISNQGQMDRLVASSIVYDAKGNQYQLPLPPIYYTLQRDNTKLAGDKKVLASHLDDLRGKYKEIEGSVPVPQFSGSQSLVGIDAAPIRGSAPTTLPSTTQPATQP